MPASREWSDRAVDVLVAELGQAKASVLIGRIQNIPGANNSVKQTLIRLRAKLKERGKE